MIEKKCPVSKNILLLFLSTINVPGGKISEAHYENISGENKKTTNESAVRYLLEKTPLDKIFIIASEKTRQEIQGYNEAITHLDFFLERVKKFCPEIDCEMLDLTRLLEYSSLKIGSLLYSNYNRENYFRIRGERNLSNHAREDPSDFKTADELRNFLSDALNNIIKNMPAQ